MKRKIRVVLLILCFVAPWATTFLILSIQKQQVKNEVKKEFAATLSNEHLVRFSAAGAGEKQMEADPEDLNEFVYEGEMYDIVRTEVVGDSTYYWCWQDHEETRLNKQLDHLVAMALDADTEKQESENRLLRFFDSLFFSQSPERITIFTGGKREVYGYRQSIYRSVCPAPATAPPEIV
ncbi:MAG: hypothetical protein V4649_13510 [Bacteroidota bacterium]